MKLKLIKQRRRHCLRLKIKKEKELQVEALDNTQVIASAVVEA